MKKILATLMAIAMVLSLVTIPVMAESADTATSVAKPGSANNVQPADAATLDEALNVPGGTITFVTEGDYPWVISGDAAVSTNVNVASSTSTVSATVTAAAGDIVQFDYMSFGEGTSTVWDGLEFYVDGTKIIAWSRVEEIATYAYALTEGEHILSWTYKKDSSVNQPGDYAWLDNVYVGEPVQPSAVVVEDVTVPAGRRAPVQYTVLPAEAFDKSVTFTIAEESIATVDANGVVTGVAEGTTTITVTTVNGISGIATVTVTEALPTANLVGYIAYDPSGSANMWGTFADYDPATIVSLGTAPATFAAASAGTTIYGYNYADGDTRFYTIDTTAGMTPVYTGVTSGNKIVLGMAYDYNTNIMYAVATDDTQEIRGLYIVDRALGALTHIADFDITGNIATFAIDNEGNAYGIEYETGILYGIDLETAHCTEIGSTGVTLQYVQSMTWDMNTNQLFWANYNTTGTLYIVDPATAQVSECGIIGGGAEVLGLCSIYDVEVPAPEAPEFTVTFVDGSNDAVISSMIVEAGTVLDPAAFPEAPAHEGLEFTGWDYNNAPIYADTIITAQYFDPDAPVPTGWYFESDPAADGWTWIDQDGDGNNWQWVYDAGLTVYEGLGVMNSQSYINYVGPLTPDNWLVTPTFVGGGSISFYMAGQDPAYAAEPIGVYVSMDGGATWGDELAYFVATGDYVQQHVDLSDYAGVTIQVAFRHYDVTDQFSVNIDQVEVTTGGDTPVETPTPIVTDEPVTDEPVTDEPVTDEPVTDEPVTEVPVTEVPGPGEDDIIFTMDQVYGMPGEEVTVSLTVDGEFEVHNVQIRLYFDTSVLTLVNIERGEVLTAAMNDGDLVILDTTTTEGYIALGIACPMTALSTDGVIYTITFRIAEDAEVGTVVPLEPEVAEFGYMPVGETFSEELPRFVYNGFVAVGEEPVVTDEPVTDAPVTDAPVTDEPNPPTPPTGTIALVGLGVAAVLAGAGIVLFRKKED